MVCALFGRQSGGYLKSIPAEAKGRVRFATVRRVFLIASLLLALTATMGAADCAAQVAGAQFDNARLERLRGLAFKRPVPVVALKAQEAQQIIEHDLKRDYSDERLRADGMAGSVLGLFLPRFDLESAIMKQVVTQFGGVYSEHLKEIVLIGRGWDSSHATIDISWLANENGPLGNSLAHELTHALQDQHFDLEGWHEKLKDEEDRATAFDSVIEGDATLAAVAYTADRIDVSVVNRFVANLDGWTRRMTAGAHDYEVPAGLAVPKIFTHTQGIKFVAEAYRRGGWRAVDALYRNPPVSTAQIIDPRLYFDLHRLPVEIKLAGYQAALPAAALIHTDSYGELLLSVILERNLAANSGYLSLAQRWAGDRMAILKQGGAVTVVWMVVFGDAAGAAQFAAVYSSILDRLHGPATAHRVEYRGNAVLCVVGNGLRQHPELASQVWQQTIIGAAN